MEATWLVLAGGGFAGTLRAAAFPLGSLLGPAVDGLSFLLAVFFRQVGYFQVGRRSPVVTPGFLLSFGDPFPSERFFCLRLKERKAGSE